MTIIPFLTFFLQLKQVKSIKNYDGKLRQYDIKVQ